MSDLISSPLQVRSDPGSFGWTSLGPYLADLEVQKLDDATIVMDMHKMLADGPYGLCTMVRILCSLPQCQLNNHNICLSKQPWLWQHCKGQDDR